MENLITNLAAVPLAVEPGAVVAQSEYREEDEDAGSGLSVSGSWRGRYQAISDQVGGPDGPGGLWSSRLQLKASFTAGATTFFGELEDARLVDAATGTGLSTSSINTLEPLQLYVSHDAALANGATLSAKAGRFTMDVGSRRFVSRTSFSDAADSFAGVRMQVALADGTELTAFATRPMERRPDDFNGLDDNTSQLDTPADHDFLGIHLARPLAAGLNAPRLEAEAYLFINDGEDLNGFDGLGSVDIATLGGRLHHAPAAGRIDFDLEGALQRGQVTTVAGSGREVRTGLVHADIGYSFATPAGLRAELFFDWASGDAPGDEHTGFIPLFGSRGGDFGPSGLYGALTRNNISAPGLRLEYEPSDRLEGSAAVRGIWLAEEKAALPEFGLRDETGASGGFVGVQSEAELSYALRPDSLYLETGLAWLSAGSFLREAPGGGSRDDRLYGHIDLIVEF